MVQINPSAFEMLFARIKPCTCKTPFAFTRQGAVYTTDEDGWGCGDEHKASRNPNLSLNPKPQTLNPKP